MEGTYMSKGNRGSSCSCTMDVASSHRTTEPQDHRRSLGDYPTYLGTLVSTVRVGSYLLVSNDLRSDLLLFPTSSLVSSRLSRLASCRA